MLKRKKSHIKYFAVLILIVANVFVFGNILKSSFTSSTNNEAIDNTIDRAIEKKVEGASEGNILLATADPDTTFDTDLEPSTNLGVVSFLDPDGTLIMTFADGSVGTSNGAYIGTGTYSGSSGIGQLTDCPRSSLYQIYMNTSFIPAEYLKFTYADGTELTNYYWVVYRVNDDGDFVEYARGMSTKAIVLLDEYNSSRCLFQLFIYPISTQLTVIKAWDDSDNADGIRPESITLTVYANGEATDITATITPDGNGNWTYTFLDLPAYDADGKAITYSVVETVIDGYETTYGDVSGLASEGYTVTVTNTHTPETISISDTKALDDSDINIAIDYTDQTTFNPKTGINVKLIGAFLTLSGLSIILFKLKKKKFFFKI